MRKLMFVSVIGLCFLLQSGCFWGGNTPESRVFDIADTRSSAEQLLYQVHFSLFRNISGSDRRFLKRLPDNRMTADEFNRWLQDPELMLERYFRNRFRNSGAAVVRVRGVITLFEINSAKHCSELAVDFTLFSGGAKRVVSLRAEKSFAADSSDPDAAAAEAMTQCANSLADQLDKQIRQMIKTAAEEQEKNK